MRKWFARIVLLSGVYDSILAVVFIFASPLVSIFLDYPLTPLSGALLQIIGAFLLGFGLALLVASRNLGQLLIIPVVDIPARLLAFVIIFYYVFTWGLPPFLLLLGSIEASFAIVFTLFVFIIKDYSFQLALTQHPA